MQILTIIEALLTAAAALRADGLEERAADEPTELVALAPDEDDDIAEEDAEDDAEDDAEAEDDAPARWLRHRVVPRETIEKLALRYRVKAASLRQWNELASDEQPEPKDKLRIYTSVTTPPRVRVEYTVAPGDTWISVARAHGADPAELRLYNYSRTRRELDPGEVMEIWADPTIRAAVQGDAPRRHPPELATVRPGAFSVGYPHRGKLVNGVRLPETDTYELRYPNSAWGTTFAVRTTIRAFADFRARSGYEGLVRLGTMSRRRGGHVGGHRSHQSGRDLDVRLPIREELNQQLHPRPRRVDWLATWHLIKAFLDTGAVRVIFFDYKRQKRVYKAARAAGVSERELDEILQWPWGQGESDGRVRHSHGHTGHLHVRFRCAPYETECRDL